MSDSLSITELGGTPWAKFEEVGARLEGVVVSATREQQRDYDTGDGMTWSNGEPRMETVVKIALPDGEVRAIHARGGTYEVASGEGTSLEQAIVDAVVAAGGTTIDKGGHLEVVHSGLGKAGKFNAKLYRARYTPPTASLPISDLFTPSEP